MTVGSPADKRSLNHPPPGSVALDGSAEGDTSLIDATSSSRETPPSPSSGRPSRQSATTNPGTAARTRARNKAAATRYRIKMQNDIAKAEEKKRDAEFQRDSRLACVNQLREEVLQLKSELLEQASCGCPLIQGYLSDVARTLDPGGGCREHPEHSNHPETSNHPESCDTLRRPAEPVPAAPQETMGSIAGSSGGGMAEPHQMILMPFPDQHQMVLVPLSHPESQLHPDEYQ
ncbi:hypothetical protein C8A00DRAFT_33172 [Chaetomidium leptoderma]|uniref:BZIP domain-containing protein n=1 Tax=Chaetomidium leptoderma TaxID=669021 RepID=A0AAN6VMU6_9PEZI|nr:hypothetical protein C8A00DRAFT_33172 [Chaetomidium leptoderma]